MFKEKDQVVIAVRVLNFVDSLSQLWAKEPLDGDETDYIAKCVLDTLNYRNGNEVQ